MCLSNPLKDSWFISSTLKGIDRVKGTAVNRKSPITPDILLRIKKVLKMSDRDDIIFGAACLVMFFGLFRKANLFAKQKFDADKHFTRDSFCAQCRLFVDNLCPVVQDHPMPGTRNQGHTTSPPPSSPLPRVSGLPRAPSCCPSVPKGASLPHVRSGQLTRS